MNLGYTMRKETHKKKTSGNITDVSDLCFLFQSEVALGKIVPGSPFKQFAPLSDANKNIKLYLFLFEFYIGKIFKI